jgi:hypothetical protein
MLYVENPLQHSIRCLYAAIVWRVLRRFFEFDLLGAVELTPNFLQDSIRAPRPARDLRSYPVCWVNGEIGEPCERPIRIEDAVLAGIAEDTDVSKKHLE